MKECPSVPHQKKEKEKRKSFRFRWLTWDFWVSHNCWHAKNGKKTLLKNIWLLWLTWGENAGSPNKTTSPAARQHRCMQSRTSMFTFNSPVKARDRLQWRGATLLRMHFHYPQWNKKIRTGLMQQEIIWSHGCCSVLIGDTKFYILWRHCEFSLSLYTTESISGIQMLPWHPPREAGAWRTKLAPINLPNSPGEAL